MTTQIGPLSEDIKEEIIATQPNGIWLVLTEETPRGDATAEDLLSVDGTVSALGPPSQLPPACRIDHQWLNVLPSYAYERSMMMVESAVPEQSCEHSQRVAGQRLVNKRLLPLERFQSTATWSHIVVEGRIDNLREHLGDRAQTIGLPPIAAVQRLPEHELSAVGGIAEIEVVRNSAPQPGDSLLDLRSSGSRIDAPDDKVKLPQPVLIAQTLWARFPAEIPEQVDP